MYANVIVDISNDAVDKVFDYVALQDTKVGMRVKVPFGARSLMGYVLKLSNDTNFDKSKVKPIIANLEKEAKLKKEILSLVSFMAEKFFLRLSDCIKLVLPSCVRLDSQHQQNNYYLSLLLDFESAINIIGKRAKGQLSAVAFLNEQGEVPFFKMVEIFGRGCINALIQKGIVLKNAVRRYRTPAFEKTKLEKHTLTLEQLNASNQIKSGNGTFLIKGVTGSGKTEVYMSVIEEVLSKGKTAIMLVPEISLTPQMMQRFNARFPNNVAVLHSGLSEGERFDEWNRIFSGEAKVVLGARSAVFAPVENLGVIIIDEEHDGSYVSESNPRFFTHDVAKFRSEYNN